MENNQLSVVEFSRKEGGKPSNEVKRKRGRPRKEKVVLFTMTGTSEDEYDQEYHALLARKNDDP